MNTLKFEIHLYDGTFEMFFKINNDIVFVNI